jgi:hypothetical protein
VGTALRKLDTDWITGQIIGGAIDVHRYLGNVDALAAGGWKRVLS